MLFTVQKYHTKNVNSRPPSASPCFGRVKPHHALEADSLSDHAALLLILGIWLLTRHGNIDTTPSENIAATYIPPRGYVCYRGTPVIDGRLDQPVWEAVPWTEDFVDIEGDAKPRPRLRTRAKMLWDDDYFYVGAELTEPHIWGSFTKHDSYIFTEDPDFEVFIDPDGDSHEYAEFEINALNTGWDLLLTRPYKDGGSAIDSWDIHGLKSKVHVEGTINDPSDTDRFMVGRSRFRGRC